MCNIAKILYERRDKIASQFTAKPEPGLAQDLAYELLDLDKFVGSHSLVCASCDEVREARRLKATV